MGVLLRSHPKSAFAGLCQLLEIAEITAGNPIGTI